MRQRNWPTLGVLTATLLGLGVWIVSADTTPTSDAGGTTAETCADCHAEYVADLRHGHHSALDTEGLASRADAGFSCAACHGDPTKHLAEGTAGTIFAFADEDSSIDRSSRCLTCHATEHPKFQASAHAKAGLACNNCHASHDQKADWNLRGNRQEEPLFPEYPEGSATCSSCHSAVFAEFEFNERHRLQEGVLECASCHNPHEPQTRVLLGGFKQQACTTCHADKDGPFVFEHGSSRVEGCTACHAVHGSPNRHMLAFQSVADTCYSCHPVAPAFHTRFTAQTVCTNCHSAIHGSNFDKFFLK